MTEWETIYDKSSHISRVKLVPPKNYSVERGDGIFEAVSIQNSGIRTRVSHSTRKRNSFKMKSIALKMIVFTLVGSALSASLWKCSKQEYATSGLCTCVIQLRTPYNLYNDGFANPCIEGAKDKSLEWIEQTKEMLAPYLIKMKAGYHWSERTNVKTAFRQLGSVVRTMLYTVDDELRPLQAVNKLYVRYLLQSWTWFKELANSQSKKWLYQLEDYVNSPTTKVTYTNLPEKEDSMVEDKLKKTAKRILEYIDQLHQESMKSGMKKEEAKEKAHEIIKSIKDSTIARNEDTAFESDTTSSDAGVAAFEIQSIMETALREKVRLEDQLGLILLRVQALSSEEELNEDTDLFVGALKTEIDQLRATAENNIRQRTKLGLKHVEGIKTNALVAAHMKEDIQSAQRAALKELRQTYVQLYQTNEEIDKIMHL